MILVYDVPFNSHNIFSVPLTDSKLTQLFIKRYVQFTMFINIDDTAKLADIRSTLCLYRISVVSYPLNHFYISTLSILQRLPTSIFIVFLLSHKYFVYMFDIIKIASWPTLSRHCVFIVPLHYCLHRHLNQHQVDIVIMTEMESTSPC